jgi:hypothetical protein
MDITRHITAIAGAFISGGRWGGSGAAKVLKRPGFYLGDCRHTQIAWQSLP